MSKKIDLDTLSFEVSIPSAVLLNPNLDPACVKLFAFIKGLTRAHGYCYATNNHLAQLMDSSEKSIQRWLGQLKSEELLEIITNKNGLHWQRHIYLGTDLKKCLRSLTGKAPPPYQCPPPTSPVSPIYKEYIKEDIGIALSLPQIPEPAAKAAGSDDAPPKEKGLKEVPKEALGMAAHLATEAGKILKPTKDPNLVEWALELDRLHRIDGKGWDDIKAMIDWSMADTFWCKQIRSASNLRKHWDKMDIKRMPINTKATWIEKNRALAQKIKHYLVKEGFSKDLMIYPDGVFVTGKKESIMYDLPHEKFKEIVEGLLHLTEVK